MSKLIITFHNKTGKLVFKLESHNDFLITDSKQIELFARTIGANLEGKIEMFREKTYSHKELPTDSRLFNGLSLDVLRDLYQEFDNHRMSSKTRLFIHRSLSVAIFEHAQQLKQHIQQQL